MRIRAYRLGDIPLLMHVQHQAATFDRLKCLSETDFVELLARSIRRTGYNVFLLTDDDDEVNTWGQGESLEGVEGELIGYTLLQLSRDEAAYRFYCHGTVLPSSRGRGAGHGLVLCALNHARLQSLDFIAHARQQDIPIYFDVPLPVADPGALRLASDLGLEKTDEPAPEHLQLYRQEL